MYQDTTPGVRFEWLDPPPLVIPRRTDIAGFVGIAARGPLHEPVRIDGWTQFMTAFGSHIPESYLAYAVEGFFENGGATCWVIRVADPAAAAVAELDLYDAWGSAVLRLKATSEGTWGSTVIVTVSRTAPDRFTLTLRTDDGASELWRELSMDPADPRYVRALLNDDRTGSALVDVEDLSAAGTFADITPSERGRTLRRGVARLGGGARGVATLRPEHFSGEGAPPQEIWGLKGFETVDDVGIVAIPDLMTKPRQEPRTRTPRPPDCAITDAQPLLPPAVDYGPEFPPPFTSLQLTSLQNAVIGHCERQQDRVAILDPPLEATTPDAVVDWRGGFATSYAALYWPWLQRPDPLELDGLLRAVPPSGHVAGVYARGDRRIGVHKPPANEILEGVNDVTALADDAVHGDLNARGVNVIRTWNGLGIRVAGARTLLPEPGLRYVNVRRLLNMIEEAILEDTPWTVFEPNTGDLWREVDRVVRGFLDRLWRQGVLDGATGADAYSVTCDETTNPPEDVDLGRLTCRIGVQPPWPAEFVVVRIGRTDGGAEIIETAEAIGG
jgi:uncharacterized protein